MKIYIDSCDVDQIKKYKDLGFIDGVTTNPSIIAKSGRDFKKVVTEICNVIDTSISVEVISTDYENMLKEAEEFSKIAPQITIKLPITEDGLRACKILSELPIADYNKLSEEEKEDISYIKFPHKDDKIQEKESKVELNTDLPESWGNDSIIATKQIKFENQSSQESIIDERVKGFCTNCGENISAGDKFCGSCGTKITS